MSTGPSLMYEHIHFLIEYQKFSEVGLDFTEAALSPSLQTMINHAFHDLTDFPILLWTEARFISL